MKFNKLYFNEYKDQFNYYNLITKINHGYRMYFNAKDKKFTIVNIYNNFEICKIFEGFSSNLITNLRFSRIENFNKVLAYIDNENENYYNAKSKDITSKYKSSLNEINNLHNRSKSINQIDINKIIGAIRC